MGASTGAPGKAAATRIRLSGTVAQGLLCAERPSAIYPLATKKAGVQGAVVIAAVIGTNGSAPCLAEGLRPQPPCRKIADNRYTSFQLVRRILFPEFSNF